MGDETQPLELQLGPGELARQYHARFGRPVLFAETGAPGDDATMIAWLERVVDATRSARESGVPVIGITWWGLIDQVDWGSGLRRHDYQIDPTGLQSLQWEGDRLERVPAGALPEWTRVVEQPIEETLGRLATPESDHPALW